MATSRFGAGPRFAVAGLLLGVTALLGLLVGPFPISLSQIWEALSGQGDPMHVLILRDIRLPRTVTAILVGSALGISGLLMQTLFRNPLADPHILGVSAGASFGVAFVVLAIGSSASASVNLTAGLDLSGGLLISIAAGVGAAAVMLVVLAVGSYLRSSTTLLLLGVMISYFVSSGVTVMLATASPQLVHQFTLWGFGSYQGVTWANLRILAPLLAFAGVASLFLAKSLNALLLGERYAQTMGVNLRRQRVAIVGLTSILAGTATAFCGPIAFLGIAIPHVTRGLFSSSDHRVLLPAVVTTGGMIALLADIAAQLPGENVLPLNAVNAAFGAPIVIFILLRRNRRAEA